MKPKSKNWFLFSGIAVCSALVLSIVPAGIVSAQLELLPRTDDTFTFKVVYPRIGSPLIQKPGYAFSILVDSNVPDWIPKTWSALLVGQTGKGYELSLSPTLNSAKGLWELSTCLPTDFGLYDLKVKMRIWAMEFEDVEPNSIEVIEEFPRSFKFIHATDPHIGDVRGLIEDPEHWPWAEYFREFRRHVNRLNPDFVVITGDLVSGGTNVYPLEYNYFYNMLTEFEVPKFEITVTQEGITYTLGFEKLYAGTWQVTIKAFGFAVATIEVPEYGFELEGGEASGVLLSSPKVDQEKLDQMVTRAKEGLAEMHERTKVIGAEFESRLAEALARVASLLKGFVGL